MAGVALVVVVVDLAASGPGVVMLVVVVVDLAALEPGVISIGVVIDLVALEPGVIFIVVLVDLFTFAAALRASSSIMAISMTTNIIFISKPQRKRKTGVNLSSVLGHQCGPPHFQVYRR